jgi:hypothetical protein
MRVDRIGAGGLAAALALASIGGGVWAADAPKPAAQQPASQGPVVKQHDTFQGAVSTPIEDLNMKKVPIPDVLNRAVASPYDLKGMDRCPTISAEVARIDAALGPDRDAPPPPDTRTVGDKRHDSAASVLKFGVEAVTPYRGVVRRVTGATAYEKKVQAAVEAGFARRGFLKGTGLRMNCAPPASPAWFKPAGRGAPAKAPKRR